MPSSRSRSAIFLPSAARAAMSAVESGPPYPLMFWSSHQGWWEGAGNQVLASVSEYPKSWSSRW